MSVLRRRIARQGGTADYHPYGTADTPMVMPLGVINYVSDDAMYYTQVMPLIAADGAIIPSHHGVVPPNVIPAGQG